MAHLWNTCGCFVDQLYPLRDLLHVKCICMHTCCQITRLQHSVWFEPIWKAVFQFPNGGTLSGWWSWGNAVQRVLWVFTDACCGSRAVQLKPSSWPPLCVAAVFLWKFLCSTVPRPFPNITNVICVAFASFVLSAPSRILSVASRCIPDCDQRWPVFRAESLLLLRLLCSYLQFDFTSLVCY